MHSACVSVVAGWVAVIVTLACPHSGPGRTAEEADIQSKKQKQKKQKKNKNENGKWPTDSTGCNSDGGGSSSGVDNSVQLALLYWLCCLERTVRHKVSVGMMVIVSCDLVSKSWKQRKQ